MKNPNKTELKIKNVIDTYRNRVTKIDAIIERAESSEKELSIMKHNRFVYNGIVADLEYALFYDIKKDTMVFSDWYYKTLTR